MRFLPTVFAVFLFSSAHSVVADDWTVTRLRGVVLQLENGAWQELERGMTVPDDRLVRTLNARATLQRDEELIELSPNTIIQIMDKPGADYTVVVNHAGTVGIEAEERNVNHFSVVTPHLAAVVKGTQFSVAASKTSSSVTVTRGAVLMRDTAFDQLITVTAGETARTGDGPAVAGPVRSEPPSFTALSSDQTETADSPSVPAPPAAEPVVPATEVPPDANPVPPPVQAEPPAAPPIEPPPVELSPVEPLPVSPSPPSPPPPPTGKPDKAEDHSGHDHHGHDHDHEDKDEHEDDDDDHDDD